MKENPDFYHYNPGNDAISISRNGGYIEVVFIDGVNSSSRQTFNTLYTREVARNIARALLLLASPLEIEQPDNRIFELFKAQYPIDEKVMVIQVKQSPFNPGDEIGLIVEPIELTNAWTDHQNKTALRYKYVPELQTLFWMIAEFDEVVKELYEPA